MKDLYKQQEKLASLGEPEHLTPGRETMPGLGVWKTLLGGESLSPPGPLSQPQPVVGKGRPPGSGKAATLAGSYQSPFADTSPNPLWGDLLRLGVLVPAAQHMCG